MLTFNCLSCGFLINADENAETYTCEACCNTWTHVQLTEYKQKVQDTLTKVTQDFEKIENQAKEERERRIADDERKKQTEAYIARRQADAELEKAKSANRPQTVYVNGGATQESVDNAVGLFAAKKFADAKNVATKVLSNDSKNLPARFIVAFHDQVIGKKEHQIDTFFTNIPDLPGSLSAEDLEFLCQLFESGRVRLAGYETQILELIYSNARELGPTAVCKFVDGFSPGIIASRKDGGFLSGGLSDVYMKLAAFCSIPKTCFTLLGAIESNPDSPLKSGAFYLTGKSQRFYDEYVTPVGLIIDKMRSEKNRPQFQKAFADKSSNYRRKAGI